MNKSPKKPETFIPHQQKAVRILTEIQKINKKYILLVKPKIEKEISILLNKNKPDQKTLSLLSKLLKSPDLKNQEDDQSIGASIDRALQEFMKSQNDPTKLFLSESADLYRNPKQNHCYEMEGGGIRHKIISLLIEKRGFFPSRELEAEAGCGSYKSLTDAVSNINKEAQKHIKLSPKYKLIISRPPYGYKINDFYTIFLE